MRGKIILIVCSGILANISLMICFRDLYLTLNFKIWWNNSILIANAHTCELFQLVITKKHSEQKTWWWNKRWKQTPKSFLLILRWLVYQWIESEKEFRNNKKYPWSKVYGDFKLIILTKLLRHKPRRIKWPLD